MAMTTATLAFFFMLTISTTLPSASAEIVLDTDGEMLKNYGGPYFILSAEGRGLELAKTGNDNNPVSVVQSATNYSNGLPLIVSTPYRVAFISTSFPLNFEFFGVTPSYWRIVDDSVKIGELKSVFGPFKIETSKDSFYRIVYCSESEDGTCKPLLVSPNHGILNLVDGDPLLVKFQKATQSSSGKSVAA